MRLSSFTVCKQLSNSGLGTFSALCRASNRLDNARIRSAPAEIGIQPDSNLVDSRVRVAAQQRHRRHNHPGCAVSALEGRALQKRLLHAVKLRLNSQTFNGLYFLGTNFAHRRDARANRNSLYQHSACAALPFTAPWFGTRQMQFVAKHRTGVMRPDHPQRRNLSRLLLISQRSSNVDAPSGSSIEPVSSAAPPSSTLSHDTPDALSWMSNRRPCYKRLERLCLKEIRKRWQTAICVGQP